MTRNEVLREHIDYTLRHCGCMLETAREIGATMPDVTWEELRTLIKNKNTTLWGPYGSYQSRVRVGTRTALELREGVEKCGN